MIKKFVVAVALVLVAGAAQAELSRYTAGKVQRAQTLQQEEKLGEAIALLAEMSPSKAYDAAFVQRMLGVFYWQKGDVKRAIANLSKAVESGLLKDEQAWVTQRMLADILLSDEQFKRALPHYYQLSKAIPENQKADELWLRIVQAHYQISEWKQVLSAMTTYEKLNRGDEVQPLSMKLGAQLQLQKWRESLPTLQRLIMLEPNKAVWWQQTAGIQLRLSRSKDALDTLALAKRQGVELSQQDLKTLAQLYAQRGIPERAADIYAQLKGAKTDVELVSSQAMYWQMAKEWDKAISTWAKAAELDNKHRWPLAQLLLQEGHYRKAIAELDKVTLKGRKDDVELAKVRAYYKLENYDKAIIHAKLANNIKSTSASKSWIKYLSQMRKMDS
ncbi:tetratricopeptide repeat protein [Photobacterium kasasachensis]|uniref:tetratricopeptide repeat protein n=1 Tax=Photobacterium kasasachensis TaxID=2910240 RepID=UPI003D0B08BD